MLLLQHILLTAETPMEAAQASARRPDTLVWCDTDETHAMWLAGSPLVAPTRIEAHIAGEWRRARLQVVRVDGRPAAPLLVLDLEPVGVPHRDLPMRRR